MTVRDALREGAAALAGTETPFLDASLLLADALGTNTTRLHASAPEIIAEGVLERFRSRLALRFRGLPVAYILGCKEFWGRRFSVDERVLVPRPDTETLVASALKLGDMIQREREEKNNAGAEALSLSAEGAEERAAGPLRLCACIAPLRVHDACTGSGCVAISLAADRPGWSVSASDLSEGALEVAAANAAAILGPDRGAGSRPGGELVLTLSDLLESALPRSEGGGVFDLIVANPPYVPSSEAEALLKLGWSEPMMALDGGADGIDLVRRLVPQAARALVPGGALLVEADGEQADAVAALFRASRFIEIETIRDLGGRPRVTSGRTPWTI
jgi:release factor glutamine methyltransferase